jgi:hypothetical protein
MENDMSKQMLEVSVRQLYLTTEQLGQLLEVVNGLPTLDKTYKGIGAGMFGTEYNFELGKSVGINISPVPEAVALYLNTFGKEESNGNTK